MPSKYLLFNIYGDKAQACHGTGEYQKALEMFDMRKEKLPYMKASDYYSIATLYDKLENYPKAIEYFTIYLERVEPHLLNKDENEYYQYALSRRNRLREQEHMRK